MKIKLNYDSPFFNIFTAFILGIIFIPLQHRIQQYIERYFFRGTQEEIALENEKLRLEVAQTEKYKTLATLAGGIAHEIRNPLTVIKTFNEYLPARHNDREFINKYSRLTAKEVERISELVNRLMEYSKPNPPKFTDVSVKKLLNQSIDTLSNNFLSRHVQCSRNINLDDQLTLRLDANQIHQALLNIMLNAVDAMPDGGQLFIGAAVLPKQIKSSVKHDKIVQITIKDTGVGIAEENLKQIFDPFFTNKDFGTGLGLAIVQGIIENHHGKILVKSKIGIGTEIIIELPVSQLG
ncbi:MAG: nitrogen regulation protein NR(II) [Candidatus Omnitrophota bacterium]